MAEEKISIIIPIFNVAPYVHQCIQSVIDQTYKNLEVIIVDDCGTDNSMEIVKHVIKDNVYRSKATSFKLLHHDHNRGLSAARNTGIEAASGEYLYFLDSDDCLIPECMELMMKSLILHPDSQIVFAGASANVDNYEWLDYTNKELPEYSCDRDWLQVNMLKRYPFGMTAWNKLVSRQFLLEHRLYFVNDLIYEDEVWNFQLSRHVQSTAFIRQNTYLYNVRENSIVSKVTAYIRWKRLFVIWKYLVGDIKGHRKDLQIRAITEFILDKTRWNFPKGHRRELFCLFLRLSVKSQNLLSFYLLVQGLFALLYPKRYYNHVICSKICLP